MSDFNVKETVEKLNDKLHNYSESLGIKNIFSYLSNYAWEEIHLNKEVLWDSENDEREWIQLSVELGDEEKEDIVKYLIRELEDRKENINKIIKALKK